MSGGAITDTVLLTSNSAGVIALLVVLTSLFAGCIHYSIAARRILSPAETVADYEDVSTKAIEILAGLLGNDTEIPLGDLGTYPAGIKVSQVDGA